ncbi:MAG: hypothetical protein AAFY88_19595 [Acidobacteriota bacterium]
MRASACPDPESVERFLARSANEEERGRLEAHAADCDRCRQLLVSSFLRDAEPSSGPMRPSPAIPADVLRRVEEMVQPGPARRRSLPVWLPAAALLAAGLGLAVVLGGPDRAVDPPVLRGASASAFMNLEPQAGVSLPVSTPALEFSWRLDGDVADLAVRIFNEAGAIEAELDGGGDSERGDVSISPASLGVGTYYWSVEVTFADGGTAGSERRLLRIVD